MRLSPASRQRPRYAGSAPRPLARPALTSGRWHGVTSGGGQVSTRGRRGGRVRGRPGVWSLLPATSELSDGGRVPWEPWGSAVMGPSPEPHVRGPCPSRDPLLKSPGPGRDLSPIPGHIMPEGPWVFLTEKWGQ